MSSHSKEMPIFQYVEGENQTIMRLMKGIYIRSKVTCIESRLMNEIKIDRNLLPINTDSSMRCKRQPASNVTDSTEPQSVTVGLNKISVDDERTTDFDPLKNSPQHETRRQGAEFASHRPPVSSNSLILGENMLSSISSFLLNFQRIH
jgi:hypothetical protein